MAERLGAATARAELEAPATLHVPLFKALVERIDPARRFVVLDLGSAQTRTLAMFSGYRCRIEIADVAESIDELNAERDGAALHVLTERLLPMPGGEPIDLVLCWDLLNYLERHALTAVMGGIARRARKNAFAHGLIVYLEANMPARPGTYVPVEDYRLVNLARTAATRPAPRYSPEDLKKCMPAFTIERGRLLANGMQEFLFRR